MDITGIDMDEEDLKHSYMVIGIIFGLAFIFPLYMGDMGTTGHYMFPNIELLNKVDTFTAFGLIYPLLACGVIIGMVLKADAEPRSYIFLGLVLLPLFMALFNKDDYMADSFSRFSQDMLVLLFVFLSLIGLFLGAKIVALRDQNSGRVLGGISGILFMIFVLLPLGSSKTSLYLDLFKELGESSRSPIGSGGTLMILSMLGVFSVYLYAALIGIVNFKERPNAQLTATRAMKIIFYATLAFPASIVISILIMNGPAGMKWSMLTVIIKLCLYVAGILFLLVMTLWEIIDRQLPHAVKGKFLITDTKKPAPK